MNTKSVPRPTQQDLATERLITVEGSALGGIQERLADGENAKWSVSDLVRLLQLRNEWQEAQPRNISVCWVNDPRDLPGNNRNHRN